MSLTALLSLVGAGLSLFAVYVLYRKQNKNNSDNQKTKDSSLIVLPPHIPKDGLVVVPTKFLLDNFKEKHKLTNFQLSEEDVGGDGYRVYMERRYTVKVPVVVDVKNPEIWTSHQESADYVLEKKTSQQGQE